MRKKILTLMFACAIVFALGGVAKVHAGSAQNVTGWIWGGTQDDSGTYTGLGWVNMNCASLVDTNGDLVADTSLKICTGGTYDPLDTITPRTNNKSCNGPDAVSCTGGGTCVDACTISNYGVNIPASGAVTGYAWSPNVGYIDFAPAAPYPAAPNYSVTRNGNNLDGWARIVDIASASAAGNAGGYLGWIKMSGSSSSPGLWECAGNSSYNSTDEGTCDNSCELIGFGDPCSYAAGTSFTYGASIDATGKLGGYAWSDEFGYINFASDSAMIPGAPKVTLSAIPSEFALTLGQIFSPTNTTLSWVDTGNVGTCTASCVSGTCDPAWTSTSSAALAASGSKPVSVSNTVTYRISCTNATSNDVTVRVGCYVQGCSSNVCSRGSFMPTISYDATCKPLSTCSTDDDCASRSSGGWIEVAP